jgi:hypothetical protein
LLIFLEFLLSRPISFFELALALGSLALALGSLALRSERTVIPHTRVLLHDGVDCDARALASIGDLHGLLVNRDTV